ncbi:MAG TPA: hypothetical protein VG055_09305 [Planctomycetaceae bacterium]|jgi:hypothetical protein|nr:hypothetical protein [Planctomycetaceae bacterium]
MNPHDIQTIDEQIRASLPDTVPPLVEQRLRMQLSNFRSRLTSMNRADDRRTPHWAQSRGWKIGLIAGAAALALVAINLAFRPSLGFAEVAATVLRQPWIRVRTVFADKHVVEGWYSPGKEIAAFVSPDSIQFQDYRLNLNYSYDRAKGTLYRLPEGRRSEGGEIESMIAVLSVIAQKGHAPSKPLEELTFLGKYRERINVLDQQIEKVTDNGQPCLDYRLTVSHPDQLDPLQMLFRVNAKTRLLRLCRMTGRENGHAATCEMQFDYPQTGPADIYALGVARSAPLVDRVPAGDLKRIVESLRAGRERMDNYRAIFVGISEGIEDWWTATPTVFYRKGNRFRADRVVRELGARATPKPPADDADMGKWWQNRLTQYRFCPQTVIRDSTTYRCDAKSVTDPGGTTHTDLIAVNECRYEGEMFPPEYSMMPEFGCRPPTGIGGQDSESIVNLHPADGPQGCILLSVRHTSERDRLNDKGFGIPDETRYWLDPARDYIVLRWDSVHFDAAGKETRVTGGSYLVEETARTPQGVWYAAKIRRKNAGTTGHGKAFDQVYHLFVDFDADLPDQLFDPPRPGRIE